MASVMGNEFGRVAIALKAADDERHEKYSLSQSFSKLPEVQVSHLSAVPNKTQKGLNHSTFQMRKFLATAPEPTVEISSPTFTACLSRVTDLPQSRPLFPSQSLCGQGRTGPTDFSQAAGK